MGPRTGSAGRYHGGGSGSSGCGDASIFRSLFVPRAALQVEIAILRHQLAVYRRSVERPKVRDRDRLLWSLLSRVSSRWRNMLYIVKPRTVIEWRRRGFKRYWARLCGKQCPGRPTQQAGVEHHPTSGRGLPPPSHFLIGSRLTVDSARSWRCAPCLAHTERSPAVQEEPPG